MQHRRMDDHRHYIALKHSGKTSKASLIDESNTLSFALKTDTQTKRFHQATFIGLGMRSSSLSLSL